MQLKSLISMHNMVFCMRHFNSNYSPVGGEGTSNYIQYIYAFALIPIKKIYFIAVC